jgi:arylsulfatase A-like enzyme
LKPLMRPVVNGILVALIGAMALAAALVDLDAYSLTRQTSGSRLGLLQQLLIGCYTQSIYFVLLLPWALLGSGFWALAVGLRRRIRPAPRRSVDRDAGGGRRYALRPGLGSLLLSLLAAPVLIASLGFIYESAMARAPHDRLKSSAPRDMNVILIVIDTLRADHLGSYGYHEATSPSLDAFAQAGARFAHSYSNAAWTKPSVASIFTSLYPSEHGATHFEVILPGAVRTLAEILFDAGFGTYAQVTNPNLKSIFNFDQGFAVFDDYSVRDRLYLAALRKLPLLSGRLKAITGRYFNFRDYEGIERANARIIRWVESNQDQDFFLYLHYMDPHSPYSAPPPYDALFEKPEKAAVAGSRDQLIADYDGEIRYVDDNLGRLFAVLRDLGIYEKSLIVITSDHGEAFGEHKLWGHGASIYQNQIRVPLIINFPGTIPGGVVVDEAVSSVDVAPTILDIVGIPRPSEMEGRSLLGLMIGEKRFARYGEPIHLDQFSARSDNRLEGVIADGSWKYVRTDRSATRNIEKFGPEELFHLESDPWEQYNLIEREPAVLDRLRSDVDAFSKRVGKKAIQRSKAEDVDSETLEQLKALGYTD